MCAASAPSGDRLGEVIAQIKIKLLGVSKPPVWRRVQLYADTRLDQLHEMIVAAFGWQDYHMHSFESGSGEFGVPDPELGFIDERSVSLGELIGGVGDRLGYTYDFGDGWEHEILVEELLTADADIHYPALVGARGACPPEDCGGPWGYAELKEILADPSHEQHQEMLDWLGLDDAARFAPNVVATEEIEHELALSVVGRPPETGVIARSSFGVTRTIHDRCKLGALA
jgi:Plasmid pRiA4b ORF-3-like protein